FGAPPHTARRARPPAREGAGAEPPLDPFGDDRMLGTVLGAVQELLAEVIVDRRVGAATSRACQRHCRGDGAAAANEELGAGADERRLRRSDAEAEATAEGVPEGAEERPCTVRRRRRDLNLASQDGLSRD